MVVRERERERDRHPSTPSGRGSSRRAASTKHRYLIDDAPSEEMNAAAIANPFHNSKKNSGGSGSKSFSTRTSTMRAVLETDGRHHHHKHTRRPSSSFSSSIRGKPAAEETTEDAYSASSCSQSTRSTVVKEPAIRSKSRTRKSSPRSQSRGRARSRSTSVSRDGTSVSRSSVSRGRRRHTSNNNNRRHQREPTEDTMSMSMASSQHSVALNMKQEARSETSSTSMSSYRQKRHSQNKKSRHYSDDEELEEEEEEESRDTREDYRHQDSQEHHHRRTPSKSQSKHQHSSVRRSSSSRHGSEREDPEAQRLSDYSRSKDRRSQSQSQGHRRQRSQSRSKSQSKSQSMSPRKESRSRSQSQSQSRRSSSKSRFASRGPVEPEEQRSVPPVDTLRSTSTRSRTKSESKSRSRSRNQLLLMMTRQSSLPNMPSDEESDNVIVSKVHNEKEKSSSGRHQDKSSSSRRPQLRDQDNHSMSSSKMVLPEPPDTTNRELSFASSIDDSTGEMADSSVMVLSHQSEDPPAAAKEHEEKETRTPSKFWSEDESSAATVNIQDSQKSAASNNSNAEKSEASSNNDKSISSWTTATTKEDPPESNNGASDPPTSHKKKSSKAAKKQQEVVQDKDDEPSKLQQDEPLQQLRWTEQETDNLLLQLEFFGDHLSKDIHKFSKSSVEQLLHSIQAVVEKDSVQRDDPLLQNLSQALHAIQLVNLDKVLLLLKEHHKAGDIMQDREVLLLCGPSGSGKTTTLHYLAGTKLEEVEEQGFFHLKPTECANKDLESFETSCCRKHVTRSLQATKVYLDEYHKDIVVCDTPCLGKFESIEEEISNGIGMAAELQRAKAVYPVLTLSRESLGSRFGNLITIIQAMTEQYVIESKADLQSLHYLFTKYENKHRTRICKQIAVLEKEVPSEIKDEDRSMFKAFVKDILKKTTPKASLALPMEEDPSKMLQELWEAVSSKSRDGKELIAPFASKAATQKLRLQLQMTVHDFTNLLAKGDYKEALHRMRQLQELGYILNEAKDCADKAREAGVKHIILISDLIKEMFDQQDYASAMYRMHQLVILEEELPEARHCYDRTTKKLRKKLKKTIAEDDMGEALSKLESLRKITKDIPEAKEIVQQGFDSVLKRLMYNMEKQDYEVAMTQLYELSKIAHNHPEAGECAWHGLRALKEVVRNNINEWEFDETLQFLQRVAKVAKSFAEARECIQLGFDHLKKSSIELFESKNYTRFISQIRLVSDLTHSLPDGSKYQGRGNHLLMDVCVDIINKKDFSAAVDVMVNLQNLQEVLPDAVECIRGGFEALLQRSVSSMDVSNYSKATSRLQKLGQLVPALSLGDDCVKRGLKPLAKKVQKAARTLDFVDAIEFLSDLFEITQSFPEVQDAVELGFEALLQRTTSELPENYKEALERFHQLAKHARKLSISGDCIKNGLSELHITVVNLVGTIPNDDTVDLLQHLNKLVDVHPEFPRALAGGLEEMIQQAAKSISSRDHSTALKQIELVGDLKLRLSVSDECVQRGLKDFSISVNKNLRYMDFSYADDLLQKLFKVSVSFPEVMECFQLGIQVLLQKAVEVFAEKRYSQAVNELKHLGQMIHKFSLPEEIASTSLKSLATIIPKAMVDLDYISAEDLLKELAALYKMLPEASECVKAGLEIVLQKSVREISVDQYKEAFAQMKGLAQIADSVSDTKDSKRRGIRDLTDNVKKHIRNLDFPSSMEFIRDLNDLLSMYPDSNEALQLSYESLLKRTVQTFQDNLSNQALSQLLQLKKLRKSIEVDEASIRSGLEDLQGVIVPILQKSEIVELIDLMERLSALIDPFSQLRDCIDSGVEIIWKKLVDAIDRDDVSTAISLLQKIKAFQGVSPLADKCLKKGLKRMKKVAAKAINGNNYMLGVSLSQQLLALDELSDENDDTLKLGYSVLREKLGKSIQERNFSEATVLIRRLVELSNEVPESLAVARRCLVTIMELTERFVETSDYAQIISVMQHIRTLEDVLPDSLQCVEHGQRMLSRIIENAVEEHDYMATVGLIEQVHKISEAAPDADDAVRIGIDLIRQAIEKPIEPAKYASVVELILYLSKSPLPGALESAKRGLKSFWMSIKRAIEQQEFDIAIALMRHMKTLSFNLDEAGDCVQLAFVALRVRLVKTIDQQDYEIAMSLLQQLSSLSQDIPEAFECAQFGFEALQEQLEKTIEQGKYNSVIKQMKELNKFSDDVPEAVDLFRLGFSSLSDSIGKLVKSSEYDNAVEVMNQLIALGQTREDALDCAKGGIFSFWGKFEERIAEKDYGGAVRILQFLGKMANDMSEAEDGVQLGFEVLQEKFERMIEQKDYDSAVRLMQDLSKLAYELPEAGSCIQNGFELLRERLVKIIEQQDYSTARHLISKLEQKLPNFSERATKENSSDESGSISDTLFTIDGDERVEVLRERLLGTIEVQEYDASIDIMLQLSNMEHIVPQAAECLELGYTTLKKHLRESIERMNCTTVLSLIETLNRQTHRLPVAGECARYGLKTLRKSVEKRLEQNDYKLAIELMDLLCKLAQELSEAYDFAQQALDCAVRYLVTIREETSTSFEELGEVRDLKLFSEMLDTAYENIEMVMETEELRSFCIQLSKKKLGQDDDTRTLQCAPCLCTSEAFCTDQLRAVAESVRNDFPELVVDKEYITVLAENQDVLLSVLDRLWLLNNVLQNCIGSEPVTLAYNDAFQKFYDFLDGVVSSAQEDFQPGADMKAFETQVVMLGSLVSGFREDKSTLQSDERKKLDDLEHRRSRLMLRFEIEVADSLQVLDNYNFPRFGGPEEDRLSFYVRSMKISQVNNHREVIYAATNSKDLSDMISGNVDLMTAEKTLSSFDKSLGRFLEHLIFRLEADFEQLSALPKVKSGLGAADARVAALQKDTSRVIQEVLAINRWPTRIIMDLDALLRRLRDLESQVRTLAKEVHDMNNTGIGAFFTGMVSDYYSCGWPNANTVDDTVMEHTAHDMMDSTNLL